MKKLIKKMLSQSGYTVQKRAKSVGVYDELFWDLCEGVKPFTMTSAERLNGLYRAVKYVCARGIQGAFVECGVWRGGSSIFAAQSFNQMGDRTRQFYLYDTFEGMSEPTIRDVDYSGRRAGDLLAKEKKLEGLSGVWAQASLGDVESNIRSSNLSIKQFQFVQGKVEQTIPDTIPGKIAILRLDTDWYESTLHELKWLYPRLEPGGVLIIDDYGHWQGARAATDEFFSTVAPPLLLTHLDYTGVIGVKV